MQRAARLLGAAAVLQDVMGVALVRAHRHEYESILADVHAQLDVPTWNAAWAEGRTMTLEQAIAYALGDGFQASEATE